MTTMGKATALESVFLTGPGGGIYEIPAQIAEQYRVSAERISELGHLPIRPYEMPTEGEDEVGGRHKVASGSGGAIPSAWTFHQTWEFGTYLEAGSGRYIQGIHRHPWGDERGEGASENEFA